MKDKKSNLWRYPKIYKALVIGLTVGCLVSGLISVLIALIMLH